MAAKKAEVLLQLARKADCVKAMEGLSYKPKLIIADPPYNQGMKYDSYEDKKTYDGYVAWTLKWMTAASNCLDPSGGMWVFCPDEWVSEVDLMARKQLGLKKKQHVIWAFTFGQRCKNKFARSHCHLLWFVKHDKKFTFNHKSLLVPSARQLLYNDKRAVSHGKLPDDTWMLLKEQLEPHMGRDKDVWLESRICGTFKERKNHSPNQIPVPVMERIVLACSDKGDRVLDPFAGTAASGVACAMHGRAWEGFDLSQKCVTESNKRIKEALLV